MEHEILQMLQQLPGTAFSAKEVGKRLDRQHYRDDSNWARPFLEGLLRRKAISMNAAGYYMYQKLKKLDEIS